MQATRWQSPLLVSQALDECGDLGADRRSARPVRVGPLPVTSRRCHRRTVPGVTSRCALSFRGRSRISAARIARSAQSSLGRGMGAAQHGDLVPKHEQLGVLGGRRAAEQDKPAAQPDEDQVEQAEGHG